MSESQGQYSRVFHFRLKPDDAEIWDSKIARSGMSTSEFIRAAVINNETTVIGSGTKKKPKATRKSDNVHPEIRKANFLLAKASNNLNQIAHRLNADNLVGLVTPATYAALLNELQRISVSIKELPHGNI